MEMDSHADTTVLGKNCVILSYTGRECDVAPYSDQYEPLNGIPVVTGATAWTSPETERHKFWSFMKLCGLVTDWIIL